MSAERSALPLRIRLNVLRQEQDEAVNQLFQNYHVMEEDNKCLKAEVDRQREEVKYELLLKEQGRPELEELKRNNERGAFAVVLIDANGAIFLDELFKNPEVGAGDAAVRLRNAVHACLVKYDVPGVNAHPFKIVARVYADTEDLAERLYNSGIIRWRDDINVFAKAFTDSFATFDFVHTGSDRWTKMEWMLPFYLHQTQCKKIFFATCHDDRHHLKHCLMRASHGSEALDKIVLVETTPASQTILRQDYDVVHFDNVFREVPLPFQGESAPSSHDEPMETLCREMPGRISPYINTGPSPTLFRTSSPAPCSQTMQRSVPQPNTNTNYKHNVPMISDERPRRTICFNDNNQRLDPVNKTPDPTALRAYNSLLKSIHESGRRGLCNAHYINGRCRNRAECDMEHNAALTGPELQVLQYKARTLKCKKGTRCADFSCFASHYCPWDERCTRPDCQFPHLKPEERTVWYRMEEGKREPIYFV